VTLEKNNLFMGYLLQCLLRIYAIDGGVRDEGLCLWRVTDDR